jgi:hypothetical protein
MHHNFFVALLMALILAEKVAGIAEPFDASDCQPGKLHCDTKTAEKHYVVRWVVALIGMAVLAFMFISYYIAVLTLLWHRAG